jgi:hypothetical protein
VRRRRHDLGGKDCFALAVGVHESKLAAAAEMSVQVAVVNGKGNFHDLGVGVLGLWFE